MSSELTTEWKTTDMDGGFFNNAENDMISEIVAEHLQTNIPDYEPEGDFTFIIRVEYVGKKEEE
jgi:hypothetical protein